MVFYDRSDFLKDIETSISGMVLFRRWFSQRKQGTPHSNVWEFDVGKLVVPRVFVESDLLMDMAKRYDLVTRVLRKYVGERLFVVST